MSVFALSGVQFSVMVAYYQDSLAAMAGLTHLVGYVAVASLIGVCLGGIGLGWWMVGGWKSER